MSKLEISPEQLQRIQAIVDPLLDDLRARTLQLTAQNDLPLVYEVDTEASR
jgi:hypothetical protein